MVTKQLIIAVEGTASLGPFWKTILSDYLDKIIRFLCGSEPVGQKPPNTHVELSLVMFNAHGPYSAFLVQRSGWTKDMDLYFQWLSAIPFSGGGFNDAAITEGLSEVLMMFSSPNGNQNQNAEVQRHCILVSASNPYPLPTPVYRPQMNQEKTENVESQAENHLSDAETLAKSFPQCGISLSVICPKQLPKLRGIYNAGKQNPRAGDPPVENAKNPSFLVLISENFMEAVQSGIAALPSYQNPVKTDAPSVPPISGAPPTSAIPAKGPILVRPPVSSGNVLPATVKVEPTTIPSMPGSSTFPHLSTAAPLSASQAVASLRISPPLSSTSQEMATTTNHESAPELKPLVSSSNVAPPLRPVGGAAANVRILNDVAQRQALAAGASIGGAPMLSNMISNGVTSSSAQNVAPSSGPSAAAASVSSGSTLPVPAAPFVSGSSSHGISQPMNNNNLQGNGNIGQTIQSMSQGNLPTTQMVSVNQNMMSVSATSSGSGAMMPTPGMAPPQPIGLNQQTSSALQTAQSRYIKVWEGNLSGLRQRQPVFITRLEGFRNISASETLAVHWPPTMQIVRLISQDHMNNKQYLGKADFLVFRAMNQHGFLGQLQEKKLCAVIQLPSQTLLLSVSDKAHRLIGMLFPGDMVVFKPQNQQPPPPPQQQQQLQSHMPQQPQGLIQMPQLQQQQQIQQQMGGGAVANQGYSQSTARAQMSSQGPPSIAGGGGGFMG